MSFLSNVQIPSGPTCSTSGFIIVMCACKRAYTGVEISRVKLGYPAVSNKK